MQFPTTPILDSGVGADANPIAGGWAGPTYTGEQQLKRLSNQIVNQAGNPTGDSYWNTSYGPDAEAYMTLATKPADGGPLIQLDARLSPMAGAPNGYTVRLVPQVGGDVWRIRRIDAGSTVALGADIVQNIEAGDSMGIQCIGNQIAAWWKPAAGAWTLLGTRTDATYIQSGTAGIVMTDSLAAVTNFGGGTVIGPTVAWIRA